MDKNQETYNTWVLTTSSDIQDMCCGNTWISENEKYFLDKFAFNAVIDLGCGTGHRTFPEYIKKKVIYTGIEKFENLINNSRYKDYILQGDIATPYFKLIKFPKKHFDITFLFGGVINGFIEKESRNIAWNNLKYILENLSDYLLIDTLTYFDWFDKDETGRMELIDPFLPPQYFYSKSEIQDLFNTNGFKLIEEKSEKLPNGKTRTHYLLESSGKQAYI